MATENRETAVSIVNDNETPKWMCDDAQKRCMENKNGNSRRSIFIGAIKHTTILTYFSAAIFYWYKEGMKPLSLCEGLGFLILIISVYYWSKFYYTIVKPAFIQNFEAKSGTILAMFTLAISNRCCKAAFYMLPIILFMTFLVIDSYNNLQRLVPIIGVVIIILCGYRMSKYPSMIKWSTVYKGLMIQIILAVFTVRWNYGREFLQHIGEKVEEILSYSYVGAAFVYSDNLVYKQAVFAFQSLSVLFFLNFLVEVLYFYQVLQKFFKTLGWCLQQIMGTTGIESVNCCISSFLGMSEAMLLIKPYIQYLTTSELQAVMLGQLSTVAGSVFAAYASFGVQPGYLITASIMSAPAALSFSKLIYPETEVTITDAGSLKVDDEHRKKYGNALSAGCSGALSAVEIVQNVIASLIALISVLVLVDNVLMWIGELVGIQHFTTDAILGKMFIPVAFLIGIPPSQCEMVGRLIAIKATVNEFVAYQELGKYKKMNMLSGRSEAIATYALCSFSNPGSIASMLALISVCCPAKLRTATELAFRAYIGGIVTCFMTASISGMLISDDLFLTDSNGNSSVANSTAV